MWQSPPMIYAVPIQTQPIEVTIDGDATNPTKFPADWFLVDPDEQHRSGAEWKRTLVSQPLAVAHDVYLIGLVALAVGIALGSGKGRRLMAVGFGGRRPRDRRPGRRDARQCHEGRSASVTDQLRYTVRVVHWAPLGVVIAVAVAVGAILRVGDGDMSGQLSVAIIGGIAAAVALSLDDPAHKLLSAVPVGVRRRLALRVAFVVPTAIVGWVLIDALAGWVFDRPIGGPGVSALLALTIVGVAATVVAQRRSPERAASIGASIALGWALSITLTGEGILGDVSSAWIHHPWIVAAFGSLMICLTPTR